MMANGTGGPRTMSRRANLFEKAAAQNHAGALERMGAFAQERTRRAERSSAAKAYYERAAALGDEDAKAGAQAAGMSVRDQGQARKSLHHPLFLSIQARIAGNLGNRAGREP